MARKLLGSRFRPFFADALADVIKAFLWSNYTPVDYATVKTERCSLLLTIRATRKSRATRSAARNCKAAVEILPLSEQYEQIPVVNIA